MTKASFFIVKRLVERSDLRVGVIRDILAGAAPRKTGPIWVVNREDDKWKAIENKRIFAMSSSCDKKEYFPPTKEVEDTFTTQLFQLAEIHGQLQEDELKLQTSRFEIFVKKPRQSSISFIDFRNSDGFDSFLNDLPASSKKKRSPATEEFDDAYSANELHLKKIRYDY